MKNTTKKKKINNDLGKNSNVAIQVKWKTLGHVRLFATPWTIQSYTILYYTIQFSRPEYWSG